MKFHKESIKNIPYFFLYFGLREYGYLLRRNTFRLDQIKGTYVHYEFYYTCG